MDWDVSTERSRRRHSRREGKGHSCINTCISAIDARKLAQKQWDLPRMGDGFDVGSLLRRRSAIDGRLRHVHSFRLCARLIEIKDAILAARIGRPRRFHFIAVTESFVADSLPIVLLAAHQARRQPAARASS